MGFRLVGTASCSLNSDLSPVEARTNAWDIEQIEPLVIGSFAVLT